MIEFLMKLPQLLLYVFIILPLSLLFFLIGMLSVGMFIISTAVYFIHAWGSMFVKELSNLVEDKL